MKGEKIGRNFSQQELGCKQYPHRINYIWRFILLKKSNVPSPLRVFLFFSSVLRIISQDYQTIPKDGRPEHVRSPSCQDLHGCCGYFCGRMLAFSSCPSFLWAVFRLLISTSTIRHHYTVKNKYRSLGCLASKSVSFRPLCRQTPRNPVSVVFSFLNLNLETPNIWIYNCNIYMYNRCV